MGARLTALSTVVLVMAAAARVMWALAHGEPDGRRSLRAFGASVAGGLVGGAVAGLGARLDMRLIALMSRSHYGEVTHADVPIGIVTLHGTMNLVLQGAIPGVAGGLVYVLVRRWLPPGRLARGALFSLLMLLIGWPAVLDGRYEYVRYVSAAVSVALFACLFPVYGFTTVVVAESLAGKRGRVLTAQRARLYRAALVAAGLLGVYQVWKSLHLVYHVV